MNVRRVALVFSLALVLPAILLGQQLPSLAVILDKSTIEKLGTQGKLVVTASGSDASSLAVNLLNPAMDFLRNEIKAEKPGILVEALFLDQRAEPLDAAAEFVAVYRHLTELSSLAGITYWSASRKEWRTFYAESWRVSGPSSRDPLPDEPLVGLPPAKTLFAFQRDLSFGANLYRYEYKVMGGGASQALLVTQTNLTKMSYGIIPLVGVEGLRTRLLILPAKEGILFYAVSAANSPPVPILNGKLQDSFSNRAEALFKWFGGKMGRPK